MWYFCSTTGMNASCCGFGPCGQPVSLSPATPYLQPRSTTRMPVAADSSNEQPRSLTPNFKPRQGGLTCNPECSLDSKLSTVAFRCKPWAASPFVGDRARGRVLVKGLRPAHTHGTNKCGARCAWTHVSSIGEGQRGPSRPTLKVFPFSYRMTILDSPKNQKHLSRN